MQIEVIESLKGSKLGLYDSQSNEQESVLADKVIDITSMCPQSKRCVIKYAKVTAGTIAQICDWYEKDKDMGMTLHYHISTMTPLELANDIVFQRHCFGANPMHLANIIFQNQPQLEK